MHSYVLALLLASASFAVAGMREYHYTDHDWKSVLTPVGKPEYPVEARRNHFAGEGRFRVHIAPNGKVTSVTVLKSTGHQLLDTASIQYFAKCHAKPGLRRELDVTMAFTVVRAGDPPPTYHSQAVLREFTP